MYVAHTLFVSFSLFLSSFVFSLSRICVASSAGRARRMQRIHTIAVVSLRRGFVITKLISLKDEETARTLTPYSSTRHQYETGDQ